MMKVQFIFQNPIKRGLDMLRVLSFVFFTFASFAAPLLDEQIIEEIFHTNKIYMLYVCEDIDLSVQSILNEYCHQDHFCAIVNNLVEEGEKLKSFIGNTEKQYFAILDSQGTKKYVLPIDDQIAINDLLVFQAKFQQGSLEPFLASEEIPTQLYEPCQKIVGKTLNHFLETESLVKVILVYRENGSCELCGEMLRMFGDIAENMYNPGIVKFGYYDMFKNDHKMIKNYLLPYFIILRQNSQQSIELPGQKVADLYQLIIDTVFEQQNGMQIPAQNQSAEQVELEFEGIGNDAEMQL